MLLPLLFAAALAGPPSGAVCSLVAYDFQREDDRTFFVAAPHPDTLEAGMGETRLGMFPEAPRPGARPAKVFGQVAVARQVGGRDTAVVEAAFRAAGSREVVLVPWEFDAGCRPAAWRRSARWAELGTAGFYVARLRQRAHWAGARPTFDVYFAGRYPYPTGSFFRAAPPAQPALTPDEYFELYGALPARRTPYPQREAAGRQLWQWAERNREVAAKPLAAQILAEVRRYYGWSEADVARILAAPPTAAAPAASGSR